MSSGFDRKTGWARLMERGLGVVRRRQWLVGVVIALLALLIAIRWGADRRVDLATFNIQDFPKSEAQIEGAFETIGQLRLELVGVQEITRPELFQRQAKRRLGEAWGFVWPDQRVDHRVGLLYDGGVFRMLGSRTHRETVVEPGAKPTLEVRLRRRGTEEVLRVFVVHLKAYSDGLELRRRQYRALRRLVAPAEVSSDRFVLLGDFNATEPEDRHLLAELSRTAGMAWRTEDLKCTSYWKPAEECLGSSLDHILIEGASARASARGPCREVGCEPGAQCPVFFRRVSDHCPVVGAIP